MIHAKFHGVSCIASHKYIFPSCKPAVCQLNCTPLMSSIGCSLASGSVKTQCGQFMSVLCPQTEKQIHPPWQPNSWINTDFYAFNSLTALSGRQLGPAAINTLHHYIKKHAAGFKSFKVKKSKKKGQKIKGCTGSRVPRLHASTMFDRSKGSTVLGFQGSKIQNLWWFQGFPTFTPDSWVPRSRIHQGSIFPGFRHSLWRQIK